jgi:hypothetical protein
VLDFYQTTFNISLEKTNFQQHFHRINLWFQYFTLSFSLGILYNLKLALDLSPYHILPWYEIILANYMSKITKQEHTIITLTKEKCEH